MKGPVDDTDVRTLMEELQSELRLVETTPIRKMDSSHNRRPALVGVVAILALVVSGVVWASFASGRTGRDPAVPQDAVNPGRPFDNQTEVPTVDELATAYEKAATCLEDAGFKVIGPFPSASGTGFVYSVSSPSNTPLAPDNPCEKPLWGPSSAFAERSTPDQRSDLRRRFDQLAECLGVPASDGSSDAQQAAEADAPIFDALRSGIGLHCLAN